MLRVLAQRRAVLATAAAALALTQSSRDKVRPSTSTLPPLTTLRQLPIYPEPTPDVLLLETPSELEQHIGTARRAVTATYLDARAQVQGVVSRWISVEASVENRIKSLVAPDEPLTPGILYVGVATLTGSVLARNRGLALRLALPPTLLLLSLSHFLPKTSANVSAYAGALEDTYLPGLAQKHDIAKAHSAMTWDRAVDAGAAARVRVQDSVLRAVVRLEEASGLKLQETLGWGKHAVGAVQQTAEHASAVAEHKVEAVEAKVQGAVEKEEPAKRLV
ncbi:apolipo protein O-domain-containing protein [Fomitopsis betulina]|nr:apolipo protein O-domain-containing protein [Fomitopsis betulina]